MIKTDITLPYGATVSDIKDAITVSLPIRRDELSSVEILKRSLVITGDQPLYKFTVAISLSEDREAGLLKMKKKFSKAPDLDLTVPAAHIGSRPVIIGAGPAGLFCALVLAEAGACPIVLERGRAVDERERGVKAFFAGGELDESSNVQFGEGGAGAFSDGKLKFGAPDKYNRKVLTEFTVAGAPEDILYTVGAHLGTDKLPDLVKAIRNKAVSFGAEFIFSARATDIKIAEGRVVGVEYEKGGEAIVIDTERVIVAAGHSAKDTLEMLLSRGAVMEQRGFGIGVRIEHRREYINRLVYGSDTLDDTVGTASYHLVTHLENGRSVYSFCMCPGGTVVAAASEHGGIVTNGMSEQSRMADNSNAAHLVSVTPADFGSDHPLAGVYMQKSIEKAAFAAAGGDYSAPYIRMDDFLASRGAEGEFSGVVPSYPRGVVRCRPSIYLPEYITSSLRAGISDFNDWMPGFIHPDAILTGAETRSTSPVRIPRSERFESVSIPGLYPIGEGAGYSGGIVSSAADGVRCAIAILSQD